MSSSSAVFFTFFNPKKYEEKLAVVKQMDLFVFTQCCHMGFCRKENRNKCTSTAFFFAANNAHFVIPINKFHLDITQKIALQNGSKENKVEIIVLHKCSHSESCLNLKFLLVC